MTTPKRPVCIAEIKLETLRSGGLLVLGASFQLPGHEKPHPRSTEAGSEGLPEGFVDEDFDGGHV